MDKLYYENILTENIVITSKMLGKNLDYIIIDKLKYKIGDKCIKEGYVKKDSIELIKRSLGLLDSNSLNGNLEFLVNYKADICIPMQNNVVECVVDSNNKMGIIAINKPLEIVLAKRHHENKEIFNILKKNDKILVKVIDKSFNLYDEKIVIIAKFIKKI
jgi:DNA-directed RNA polymerase subunit E'/Rpb7